MTYLLHIYHFIEFITILVANNRIPMEKYVLRLLLYFLLHVVFQLYRLTKIFEEYELRCCLYIISFGYLFSVNKNSGKVFRIHTMLSIVKMKTTLVVLCVRQRTAEVVDGGALDVSIVSIAVWLAVRYMTPCVCMCFRKPTIVEFRHITQITIRQRTAEVVLMVVLWTSQLSLLQCGWPLGT